MIEEFESLLTENHEETKVSYCMLYSFQVGVEDTLALRSLENQEGARLNQLVGQFAKRYSNSLDFTHWIVVDNGSH